MFLKSFGSLFNTLPWSTRRKFVAIFLSTPVVFCEKSSNICAHFINTVYEGRLP